MPDQLFTVPATPEWVVLTREVLPFETGTTCLVVGVPKHGAPDPQKDLIRVLPYGAPEHRWVYVWRSDTTPAGIFNNKKGT